MILFVQKRFVFFLMGISLFVGIILFSAGAPVCAQQADAILERRVEALENYVSTFQPTLVELSDSLNVSIQNYTKGLEASLEDYSANLQKNLDQRLDRLEGKNVVLNPFSSAYQSIETNTGTFLIAIEEVEKAQTGVRLHVNVGNPNFADYNDFTLRFIWGKKWGGAQGASYDQWRQTLQGVEVTFNGRLEKGKWNSLIVDLSPVGEGDLGYLECEMDVKSVELGVGSN